MRRGYLPCAEYRALKQQLVATVLEATAEHSQRFAADMLLTRQSTVSALRRGDSSRVSIDWLINALFALDLDVTVAAAPRAPARPRRPARFDHISDAPSATSGAGPDALRSGGSSAPGERMDSVPDAS